MTVYLLNKKLLFYFSKYILGAVNSNFFYVSINLHADSVL